MTANTPDQQITYPTDPDTADNPVAFTNMLTDVEPRLVRAYTDAADRTTRMLVLAENDISTLGTEERVEVYDGTNHVSLYTRSLYAMERLSADQLLTMSSTTLQDITGMTFTLPAVADQVYGWRQTIFFDSSSTADFKIAYTIPAGVTMRWGAVGPATGAGGTGDVNWVTVTASGSSLSYGGNAVGTVSIMVVEGELTTSATGGALQLQAAQANSEATQSTVRASTRLEAWRIL